MLNFNKDIFDFYIDYVNKELYKSKRTLVRGYNINKLVILNKINRSAYWFPENYGDWVIRKPQLLKKRLFLKKVSSYSYESFSFLPSLEIFLNVYFKIDVLSSIQSKDFSNYLSLLNEMIRKQELKTHTPPLKELSFLPWRYRPYSDYSILKYYYNFEPHRNLIRIRKQNFLFSTIWYLKRRRWVFTYKNMHTFYLRKRKTQKFEYRFFRFEGMSFRYWAKQQLQYNFLNVNSFDFLSDVYNGNVFTTSQPAVSSFEISKLFNTSRYNHLSCVFLYWLMKNSYCNKNVYGLSSYFSSTYNVHQVSTPTKHKYLKNFFSYNTPKYGHAYYTMLDYYHSGWRRLKNTFSLFKPSYWNLKKGLDLYPHEELHWELLMWWEDPVSLFFSRFVNERRDEVFSDMGLLDSTNYQWFYKTWFHEEIAGEFQSSYYKTYYNIDYLTPGWRIHTDYPKKRMGHFDPKWHERLNEYVIYKYMNIFYPSTKRYYIDYFKHPDYIDSVSFLILNFAWKPSIIPLFLYKFRPKLRKIIRTNDRFSNPIDSLKPDFNSYPVSYDGLSFFPLVFSNNKDIYFFFEKYGKALSFLVNFFTQSDLTPPVNRHYLEYMLVYLSNLSVINLNKDDFINFLLEKKFKSYSSLFNHVSDLLFLTPSEWFFYKERVIVEYTAFKRFYSLLISEYENIK